MPIMASKGTSFAPCPAGTHIAVCIDVVDLGLIKTTYKTSVKTQHKVNIVWEIDEKRDDGQPFRPRKRYTLSLHEKASLRKDLESWRGRAFTEDELRGFDLEALIGVPSMISVVHAAVAGQIYANVTAIMKAPKGMKAPPADPSYIRVQDRPKDEAPANGHANGNGVPPPDEEWVPSDDDVPF